MGITNLFHSWTGGQAALARAVGVSQPAVNKWFRGKAMPALRNLPALATALGVPKADLEALVAAERAARRSTASTTPSTTA